MNRKPEGYIATIAAEGKGLWPSLVPSSQTQLSPALKPEQFPDLPGLGRCLPQVQGRGGRGTPDWARDVASAGLQSYTQQQVLSVKCDIVTSRPLGSASRLGTAPSMNSMSSAAARSSSAL